VERLTVGQVEAAQHLVADLQVYLITILTTKLTQFLLRAAEAVAVLLVQEQLTAAELVEVTLVKTVKLLTKEKATLVEADHNLLAV
jgi:hypothetical protein